MSLLHFLSTKTIQRDYLALPRSLTGAGAPLDLRFPVALL
jgi:hypothetical protein